MKIDSVDLFYLAMPEIRDIGDGSQDALLVRLEAGGVVGWGECEASPLVSIANWVCPMSHSACKPVRESVLGQRLDDPADIERIGHEVRAAGLDITQTDHTFSGVDIAMWDLLGKTLDEPVYRLLGYRRAYPKTPYASQLFGETPSQTLAKARASRQQGYRAVKFGWGPFGRESVALDRDHIAAAREGLGSECTLMIDAGTVWGDDVAAAQGRIPALQEAGVLWLEEPFVGGALGAYRDLASESGSVRLAGGEGAHNFYMAQQLIDHGGLGYIQVDTGRIGGITPAKRVADYAVERAVTFVNHTFTTHLALSASLQPFAGIESATLCEHPIEASSLATELTTTTLPLTTAGEVLPPDKPGLGVEPDPRTIHRYLVDVEITINGKIRYCSPRVL